jgi:hypothetical protein
MWQGSKSRLRVKEGIQRAKLMFGQVPPSKKKTTRLLFSFIHIPYLYKQILLLLGNVKPNNCMLLLGNVKPNNCIYRSVYLLIFF